MTIIKKPLRYKAMPIEGHLKDFLNSKGAAYKTLWSKKILKGLTTEENERLEPELDKFLRAKGII